MEEEYNEKIIRKRKLRVRKNPGEIFLKENRHKHHRRKLSLT